MINGRMVVGRLRHTRREQSDSNKVNLPPIHLPQPISRLTGRALHTLTNATLGTRHTRECHTPLLLLLVAATEMKTRLFTASHLWLGAPVPGLNHSSAAMAV